MTIRRYSILGIIAFLFAALLAGCGGGGGGSTSIPVITPSSKPLPGPNAPATIAVKLPNYLKPPKTVAKHLLNSNIPHPNIPSSAQSITFTVNGVLVSAVNLNGNQSLYFITIPLPLGTDTIVADLYDQPNGTGNKIATTVPPAVVTIVANANNTVNITLSGIVAKVCPNPQSFLVLTGSSGTMQYNFFPVDADGNFLDAPYTPSFTVAMSGAAAAHVTLGTTTITTPAKSTTLGWDTLANGLATPTSNLPITCTGDVTFGGPYAYVSNFGDGTVSVFDQSQETPANNGGSALQTFDLQGNLTHPVGVVFDAQTTPYKVFVADFNQNHIVVMDATTNLFRSTIDTRGLHPWGLSLSPDGKFLYATESGARDQVEIFNTTTETSVVQAGGFVPGSFPTGITTFGAATGTVQSVIAQRYAPVPTLAFLTNQNSTLDPNPVSTGQPMNPTFAVAHSPVGSGAKGTVLIRETGGPGMDTLDLGPSANFYRGLIGGTLADQFVIGPNAIAVSPGAGTTAWAVGSTNALYNVAFNTQTQDWRFVSCTTLDDNACGQSSPLHPVGVAYSDNGAVLYVVNNGQVPGFGNFGTISIEDPAAPTASPPQFAVGTNPIGIAIGTLPAGATPFAKRHRASSHNRGVNS